MTITIDDIRLKFNSNNNQTSIITKTSFFYTISGFTQSHSGVLVDIERFLQKIPATYKSEKPNNITAIEEVHLKCNCVHGSILNGLRQPILFHFVLDKPPVYKIYKEPGAKLFEKLKKIVLSHITIYLEDDHHKTVDFRGTTISFTCQPLVIQ